MSSLLLLAQAAAPAAAAPEISKGIDPFILAFSLITVVVTIAMGFRSAKSSKSAADFMVAGRSVSVGWNASAISGEYLSAASFMGIAGLIMLHGFDALWYPVCYACGYLFLLLFIAGPLRRFGAYTIPDFAEGRFDSPLFRKIAVVFVLVIGFYYTMPQLKGAGVTLGYIFPGLGYGWGVAIVGAIITFNVALGGMKGITLVQAFQYWMKMFAICIPAFVLMSVYSSYSGALGANATPYGPATVPAAEVHRVDQPLKADGKPAGPTDARWISPFGSFTSKAAADAGMSPEEQRPYALFYTYSLIIGLICGTAGLPHILVRFYTNPDGVAAKKTTMWVMILIGVFYVFPPIFGALGRNLDPNLYLAKGVQGTDSVVLVLPKMLNDVMPYLGSVMSGITCAGAFAAFMSTFSGLLVSMTGAAAHDIYGRMLRPNATQDQKMVAFKISAVLIGVISIVLSMQVQQLDIAFMVGQAFSIAAASYFPLLFLSVWWRGVTMIGAATGMLTGGLASLFAVSLGALTTLGYLPLKQFWIDHPLIKIMCDQPAIWAMPLALFLMIVISLMTKDKRPADVQKKMLVLHAPESMGLKGEYI